MEYPQDFLDAMRGLLAEEYPFFLRALSEKSEHALRLNPARPGAAAATALVTAGAVPWEEDGRYALQDFRPGGDPAHFAGAYYMQDASAMAPARVLNAQKGERVLDLCAAPGGKSGQLAAALAGTGALVCNEPEPSRARILAGNLERLGAVAAVTCAQPAQLATLWPEAFDAVLVDAPCSGEGMFRRDIGARAQWSRARAQGCAARQREILLEAAKLVAPGGRLVYSTCTFSPAENEENVAWLCAARSDFTARDFSLAGVGASQGGCLRLWPHRVRGEGHFVALLSRAGGTPTREAPAPWPLSGASQAVWSALQMEIPGEWAAAFSDDHLYLSGDLMWARPARMPPMDGVRALQCGVRLCRAGRGYVKPEHALAMAAPTRGVARRLDVSEAEAARFLRGEALCGAEAGWTLVTFQDMPLGWGKGSGGQIKNHIPKGLRLMG